MAKEPAIVTDPIRRDRSRLSRLSRLQPESTRGCSSCAGWSAIDCVRSFMMFSLPPEEMLALVKQEQAERRRQVAHDALVDSALGDRTWSWHWPDGLVRLWSAIRASQPEVASVGRGLGR